MNQLLGLGHSACNKHRKTGSIAKNLLAMVSLLLLFIPSHLSAQEITGRILGSVLDSSGAAVPNAQITVTNQATGVTRTSVSGDDGLYNIPQVSVGSYTISVMATGFSPSAVKDVVVTVGSDSRVDLKMQIGSITTSVTVTEAAPLVETTSSSVGGTVDEQKVADLPLNGRNWTDLTLLQPGVTQVKVLLGTPGVALFNGTLYSSNGAPMMSNAISLDGANEKNLMGLNNASMTNSSLGVDGIQEYKVVTSLFSAEYGFSMGSQTTVVSKGGTNQFHGDAYDYLRNASLDARNYFDVLDTNNVNGFGSDKSSVYPGKRLPPFRRNDFGGSLGGPIKKDKTFFYAVYEGIRQNTGQSEAKFTFPISCFTDPSGVVHKVIPAVVSAACTGGSATGSVTVNPLVLPFADLYPQPNVAAGLPFNYTFPYLQPASEN
jgi:hypothetical protein